MISAYTLTAGGVFIVDVIVHLAAIAKEKENLRRVTKVLLMPLLALCVMFIWRDAGDEPVPWYMIAALLFGCVGDACLIDHHHPIGFPLGLIAFAIGHVLYILQMLQITAAPVLWIIVLLAAVYGAGTVMTFKKLTPFLPRKLWIGCLLYMALLSTLSATAAVGVLSGFSMGTVSLFAGTLLFLLSDTILSFEIFKGETKNGNLKVMITYIAAQILISVGFLLRMA
jgi:uncharacterized membrane protein YhhN